MQSWEPMRARIVAQLERQTGRDVDAWNVLVVAERPPDEPALRQWLAAQGVTGYPQMLLVWETFGYPDFLRASASELVDAQYADRPDLRPIFDAVALVVTDLGGEIQARKTYVSFLTGRRTFAVAQATTQRRVDLGLRLDGATPGGRLLAAKGIGNDAINVRIPLEGADGLDDEAIRWLATAYEQSR